MTTALQHRHKKFDHFGPSAVVLASSPLSVTLDLLVGRVNDPAVYLEKPFLLLNKRVRLIKDAVQLFGLCFWFVKLSFLCRRFFLQSAAVLESLPGFVVDHGSKLPFVGSPRSLFRLSSRTYRSLAGL